jgi:hypothetical protein
MSAQLRKRLVVRLAPDQHEELMRCAREHRLTLANLVRRALKLPDEQPGTRNDLPAK